VFVLRLIESTWEAGDILQWVFKIVPSFCLTDTIMFDSSKARTFLVRPELKKDSDWDVTLAGGNVLILCLHFVVWLIVLFFIELGVFDWTKRIFNILGKNRIPAKTDQQLQLDEDVV
jgi:ATP-binding cassette subfamily A (ABC1) protein 3